MICISKVPIGVNGHVIYSDTVFLTAFGIQIQLSGDDITILSIEASENAYYYFSL